MNKLRQRAFDLYKPPFEYHCGYILDSEGRMVADDGGVDGEERMITRIRGWGRISYMEEPAKLQDAVGELIAEALNKAWGESNE